VAVVLPYGVQVAVGIVEPDPREVVGADERTGHALFWPAAKVAQRRAGDDVVADPGGGATVQVGGAVRRTALWVAQQRQLLRIWIIGCGVAVVEDDRQAAI